jgi:hypothetical protein
MAVSLIILDIWENIWSVCCFCSMFCRSMWLFRLNGATRVGGADVGRP